MKRLIYIIAVVMGVAMVSSCNQSTVFDEYTHTPIAGWEKNDTLSFEIPPMWESGHYKESLGLRITGAFPFTGLTLIVNQTIYPKDKKNDLVEKADTVLCRLIDQNGSATHGQGISYYQYNFPINIYQINEGDSIHIAIRHDMKREILPGVSDVGIKITKMQ